MTRKRKSVIGTIAMNDVTAVITILRNLGIEQSSCTVMTSLDSFCPDSFVAIFSRASQCGPHFSRHGHERPYCFEEVFRVLKQVFRVHGLRVHGLMASVSQAVAFAIALPEPHCRSGVCPLLWRYLLKVAECERVSHDTRPLAKQGGQGFFVAAPAPASVIFFPEPRAGANIWRLGALNPRRQGSTRAFSLWLPAGQGLFAFICRAAGTPAGPQAISLPRSSTLSEAIPSRERSRGRRLRLGWVPPG
jgi:hypothetical protein